MDKPFLVNVLDQTLYLELSIFVSYDLLRHSLPGTGPWNLKNSLTPMKKHEIVPDVKVSWIENQLQLVSIACYDLLELLMRKARHSEVIVWHQQR